MTCRKPDTFLLAATFAASFAATFATSFAASFLVTFLTICMAGSSSVPCVDQDGGVGE